MTRPAVSVVVATRNRSTLLPRLVAALEAQDVEAPFEVVVVDDGSTDDTTGVLDRLAECTPLDVRVMRLERNRGVAAARNAGWRAGRAPLIAFTDDDCVPQPRWLAALVDGLEQTDIVQGRTMPNPTQSSDGLFAWAPDVRSERATYETCNIAYRRSALEATGGFDEAFRPLRSASATRGAYTGPVWGEDADLAWRSKATGARSAFRADAVVWHDVKEGRLRDRLALSRRQGGLVMAVGRHPALRSAFEAKWCVKRSHPLAVGAAAATVVALRRQSPLAVALMATLLGLWVRERGRDFPRATWPRVLPQVFLVDIADTAVLASGSLRHKTFLL